MRLENDASSSSRCTQFKAGWYKNEIVPVTVKAKGKDVVVSEDEEFKKVGRERVTVSEAPQLRQLMPHTVQVNFDKIPALKTVFKKEGGTITAANASTLNDGASAVVLMSEKAATARGLKPIAKILAYADANRDPKEFTIAPADAIPKVLKMAGLRQEQVDLFEINEVASNSR